VNGSKETPPELMKSKQKAIQTLANGLKKVKHQGTNPNTEWFRNQEEIVDCIKTPPENLKIEPAEKAEIASRTDAVFNCQDRGSEWQGSPALLKAKKLVIGLGKPRSSKSGTEKHKLAHKIDFGRTVRTERNYQTPKRIHTAELEQLGSIKFTTEKHEHCNEQQTTLPHKEESRRRENTYQMRGKEKLATAQPRTMCYQDKLTPVEEEFRREKEERYKQNLDSDSTNLASSHGNQRWAADSYSLGKKVNKTNTKDNNGAVHNIDKENTEEGAEVHTTSKIPGDTMRLLRQAHLKKNSVSRQQLTPARSCGQTKGKT
jgi:hypothetical protein